MLHWCIITSRISEKLRRRSSDNQLNIAFAAAHTTGMTVSHAICDLAANTQYIPELRNEIEDIIREEGYTDEKLRKTSVQKLKELDNFIQRVNPLGARKQIAS